MDQLTARIEEARKQRGLSRGGEQLRVGHGVSAEGVRHQKKLKASIIEDHIGHRGHVASTEDGRNRKRSTAGLPNKQFLTVRRNQVVLFLTISAVAIAIPWWLVLTPEPEGARIALPELFDPRYASALDSPATEKLEERIATLTENMGTLSSLISDLEARQKAAQANVDSIARAEKIVVSRVKPELPKVAEKPRGVETQPASAPSPVDPEPVTVARTSGEGTWTINLISSPDKAYAVRFSDRANSIGIRTAMQEVTVKGTLYWRVQITGFSTMAEARVYSDTAKDKLGLKDTWIMQS